MTEVRGVVLRPSPSVVEGAADVLGPGGAGGRTVALAEALVTSPAWDRFAGRARLLVRTDTPVPLLALVGRLHDGDAALIRALGWQVDDALRRLRPVAWPVVEQLVDSLASRLHAHLGAERLRAVRLVGVPRGGLVVAGLLAYALGLRSEQLEPQPEDDRERLVVDDCALSGSRTRRWLAASPGPPVILAHLHSHPALRVAAERLPGVVACVAAADLADHAPDVHGDDYPLWRERWAERVPDDLWTGHPDHVVYPWNEPDVLVWDDAAGVAEPGWHVVPPDWCAKNRRTKRSWDVGACQSPHVPPDVLWGALEDGLVLVSEGRGTCAALEGTAATFWAALLADGDLDAAAQRLSEVYGRPHGALHADLSVFVDALQHGGWWASRP